MLLLSLDIAKALDTLSWEYLFCIIRKWGILDWLSKLVASTVFHAHWLSFMWGVHLFWVPNTMWYPAGVLGLEPLAWWIRQSADIKGL